MKKEKQIQKDYHEIEIIEHRPWVKSKNIIMIILLILVISSIVIALLNVCGIFSTDKIKGRQFYYLYVNIDATNQADAEDQARKFRVRGAAGLVEKEGEQYKVLLGMYPNKADCTSVQNQLALQGTIASDSIALTCEMKLGKLTSKQKKTTKEIYEKYLETIDSIYQITVELDKNETTESIATVRLNQLAILWEQRALGLDYALYPKDETESNMLPLYNLCLKVTALLQHIVRQDYDHSLITYAGLTRQTMIHLVQIQI